MQRRRRLFIRLLIAAACLAALGWTVARLGPAEVLRVARQADPTWLALSIVPVIGRFVIWGFKWNRILIRQARVPWNISQRILLAGSFVNLTTPTAKLAGGVLRAALLHRRYDWGLAVAYGRAFVDQATNAIGTLTLFGLLAVAAYATAPELETRNGLLVAGLLVLTGLIVGLALRGWTWNQIRRPALREWMARLTPSRFSQPGAERGDWVHSIFYPMLGEGPLAGTLVLYIALATVSFGSLCVGNAMVLRALGIDANIWLISAAVVLGYFAGILVGWGGIGVTEAALTGLYVQFGIAPEVATAAALLHRASFYLVILAWGGYGLFTEGRSGLRA